MRDFLKWLILGALLIFVSGESRNETAKSFKPPSDGGINRNNVPQDSLQKILLESSNLLNLLGGNLGNNAQSKFENGRQPISIPNSILSILARAAIPTTSSDDRISPQCREDSRIYAEALANFDEWALKMFDATGKIPTGIANNNLYSMGHFDQCLQIRGPEVNSVSKFTGKYCTLFLEPKAVDRSQITERNAKSGIDILGSLNFVKEYTEPVYVNHTDFLLTEILPSIGVCLPSSCSAQDIAIAVAGTVSQYVYNHQHAVVFTNENYCTVGGTVREYDTTTMLAIYFFSLLALLLVLGTACDVFLRYKAEPQDDFNSYSRFLLSFSLLVNVSKVLDTKASASGQLSCLHGIRFLSMAWVILAHVWMVPFTTLNMNRLQAKQEGLWWPYQITMNAALAVDSFFFLSGLLVAYGVLRDLAKRNGKLSLHVMYLKRYLRLTPVYAVILAFVATLYAHVSTGPYWGSLVAYTNSCRREWWKHFLYINNLFPDDMTSSTCMRETWYLAADMQMYLVSPIFIFSLWYWPKRGLALLGGALTIFTAVSMLIIAVNDLPLHFITVRDDHLLVFEKYFVKYYQVPWCRIQPYLVGLFMGFVLYKTQNYKIKMNPWLVAAGWFVFSAMGLAVLFGLYGYTDEAKVPVIPTSVSVMYAGLHRTAWAISLSWLVFACIHGYGGFVNRILSWPAIIPLSRLTYCTYLVHLNWLILHVSHRRTVPYASAIETVLYFLGTLTLSLSLAFVVSVCVEFPCQNLLNLYFKAKSPEVKDKNENSVVPLFTEGHCRKCNAHKE